MGLDMGLEKAGIHVLSACEFDKACRKTITANRPDIGLIGDVWQYTAETYEITETGIRVKVGKGLKSKYVALDFSSVEGSSLELDAIRLHLDEFKEPR